MSPERRARLERAAGLAAIALALAGVVLSIVFAGRIWREFTNPVSSQISSASNRLGSASSSNRWRWWGEEWSAFTAHPFGGTGAGTFKVTDLRVRQSPITSASSASCSTSEPRPPRPSRSSVRAVAPKAPSAPP
jgi:O-antigen ligase